MAVTRGERILMRGNEAVAWLALDRDTRLDLDLP